MAVDVRLSFWHSIWTGYVFWTLFSSLPAMIWFYPLNELEISGYEAFIVILLTPAFLRCRRLRNYFQDDSGDMLLKLLRLVGIFSYCSPTTLVRLCLLTVGTGGTLLKFVCDLMSTDIGKRKYSFWGYTVGFMAILCTRIWYRSIMPAFNDNSSNLLVFALTFLNGVWTAASFGHTPPTSELAAKKNTVETQEKSEASFILTSLGAGSLFYVMHAIFGEVSTPCRWVNGPYPNDVGPQPLPWGLAIYIALLIGFRFSHVSWLISNPAWSLNATVSFLIMYTTVGWGGFFGALVLAVYIASIWPTYMDLLFRRLREDLIGPAVALSMLVYVLEALFSVWTVAYNFVPGGVYTRESTGYLIVAVMTFISLGMFVHKPASLKDHMAFTMESTACKTPPIRVWNRFIFLAILAASGTIWRMGSWKPGSTVPSEEKPTFTAMIWTYHFGYDNKGWPSLNRTAKLIGDLQADVVGLLETDASRPYMSNNDLAQWLAENLQMYVDFGPNTRKHTWGSMLLSRFPIIRSVHHLLPSPQGELAPAISAELNISGTTVAVVVTHFGNDRDDEDRRLQAKTIADLTSGYYAKKIPTIFLGYVTSRPQSRDYNTLSDNGNLKDIDESDKDRFCEYIFYNRLNRLAYARVSHGGLSDTEIQVAKFKIPELKSINSNVFNDIYDRVVTDPGQVPEEHRFSSIFGNFYNGHYYGINDHHYHMSTPKYFLRSKEL